VPVEYDEELVRELKKAFASLVNPVKLLFFTDPESECEHCDDIRGILSLLASASDKVSVSELTKGSVEAKRLDVRMYPAIVVHGVREYNIRFFGTPAGYEFAALVEDVIDASRGEPKNLNPRVAAALRDHVAGKTVIKVFVTPTCPYCPLAVRAAHRFAMVNDKIYGDMIEALEFPELADAYGVYAVPKIVIEVDGEDRVEFEGAVPDAYFAAEVLRANGVDPASVGVLPARERRGGATTRAR
jgi:glutaredoxin-like protein